MPTHAPVNSQASPADIAWQTRIIDSGDIQELISLATRGLVRMFDPATRLFCHRLLRTKEGLVREGLSPRYTIMTLLGLRELELSGTESPFDIRAIYESLLRNTNWIHGAGDLGLLIWLTAAFDPSQLEDLLSRFDCETALDRFSDLREARTMELAWFLTGLAHAAEASPKLAGTLTDLCVETYHRIEENQGEYGLFGHMSTRNSLTGRLRGRIGSFADQIYPVYAMSKFAQVFQVEDPLGPAMECATAICGAQGESGQWWWLYDSHSGRVSSRYPVYSVHQQGMAPMGLFAVEKATGRSFKQFIYKGLEWIYGANELNVDMRASEMSLIWRCILPERGQTKLWEIARSAIRPADKPAGVLSLKVLYEQRPYEFGWLLFAFAGNSAVESLPKRI